MYPTTLTLSVQRLGLLITTGILREKRTKKATKIK